MSNIRLPRLLDASLREITRLEPLSLSIELNLAPFSTAVMTLPASAPDLLPGQFIELYTPHASAGIFRVEQTERRYPAPSRVTLVHGLSTLADSLVFAPQETTLPVSTLLQNALSRQDLWRWGAIDLPQEAVITWQSETACAWECLQTGLQQFPTHHLVCDQTSLPWVVHLLPLPGECLSECRLSRNLRSLNIETDRSELCTQLHLPGIAQPLTADTTALWGVVERTFTSDSALSPQELVEQGQMYLEQHKNPHISITLDALELSRATGSALDRFQPGGLCRICLMQESVPLLHRIVSLSYPDVLSEPDKVRLTLSSSVQDASAVLSGLVQGAAQFRRQLASHTRLARAAQEKLTQLDQDMQRYITTEELSEETGKLSAFFSGASQAARMLVDDLSASSLHFAAEKCTWGSTEVVTDVTATPTGEITVYDAQGNKTGTAFTGVQLTPVKQTIHYITLSPPEA